MKELAYNVKYLIRIVFFIFLIIYGIDVYLKSNASLIYKESSRDGDYLAEIFYVRKTIFFGNSKYLVKISNSSGEIVATSYKTNSYMGNIFWDCGVMTCSGFMWSTEEGYYIKVPPSWFDRVLAKMP